MKKFTVLLFTMVFFFVLGSISFSFAEDIDADAINNIDPQESEAGNVYEVQTKDELIEALGKLANGDTILLVDNIDLEEASLTVTGEGSMTIDFNGFTITSNCSGTQMLYVTGGSELTLKDGSSAMNGGLFATKDDGTLSNLIRVATDGKLVIESGSYHQIASNNGSGMIDSRGSNIITINGGTFTLDNVGTATNKSPWILNTSGKNERKIIVNGGTYNDDVYHQHFIFEVQSPVNRASKNNGDGTWTIVDAVAYINEQHKSGKWYTEERGYATLQEAIDALKETESTVEEVVTLLVNGQSATASKLCTINKNGFTAKILPQNGLAVNETADAYIVEEAKAFSVSSNEDLTNAINEANSGDTITLLSDITIDTMLQITKAITLDLNGKTITASCQKAIEVYANATIKNGTIEAVQRCVDTRTAVELTLEDLTLVADKYTSTYRNPQPLTIGGATNGTVVIMNNVDVYSGNAGYCIITFVETDLTATNCEFYGYNTLYVKPGSENSEFNFKNSVLTSDLSNNDVEGNSFSVIAVTANNVSVNIDESSTVNAIGNNSCAFGVGAGVSTPIVTGVEINSNAIINGNILSTDSLAGNSVVVPVQYAEKLTDEGYSFATNEDGTISAVISVKLSDVFGYKGVSTDGSSITTGYTIDHANLEKYVAQNGIEAVEFGGTMAIEKISNGTLDFDFTNLAKTLNYNIIIRDVTEEYYDLPLIMTIYVSFDGSAKKYVSKEGTLVESDEIVAVSYNEIA